MNYWAERNLNTQERLSKMTIGETEKQLRKYYANTMKNCVGRFLLTYNKVFLSMEKGLTPTPADLYKLDTYWHSQALLQRELQALGDKENVLFGKRFAEHWLNVYNSLAIKDGEHFNSADIDLAKQMINQIWCADGKSWSNRIWTNTEKLQEALNDGLIDCLVNGSDRNQLKDRLMYEFNVSYNNADSIVRTEIAHIQTQAANQRYKDAGITEVMVWADEDERRCDICGKLHEKRLPVNAQMPVPAHPRCRCRIIPVIE